MRAIVQRVSSASVMAEGLELATCRGGLVLLVGVHKDDTPEDAKRLADRIYGLRIFSDLEGKINLSLSQAQALDASREFSVLAVSNFTVYGDATKSRRPSFLQSAGYEVGRSLFEAFVVELTQLGAIVGVGKFGADMKVALVNDGPVTLVVDTR
jgi:D-tyrosyl-tRNA(Tyr) deacylase